MQQTIDDRSQAQQTQHFDHQPVVGTKARRFVRGRVGPFHWNHAAASVGKQQEEPKPFATMELTEDLQGLPLADMRLAGDPDRDRKLTEVGSVSGSPSEAWIGGT